MKSNYCIANLLKLICLLQDNSTSCPNIDNCHKSYLGPSIPNNCYDTRVIQIYEKNGSLLTINNSTFYKVITVNNNCCKLLILNNDNNTYSSTNEFITIQISCIGAIQCIQDINL